MQSASLSKAALGLAVLLPCFAGELWGGGAREAVAEIKHKQTMTPEQIKKKQREMKRRYNLACPGGTERVGGLPPEAPGGVANWTGWRIVHALMERDPDIKLIDLLSVQDPQTILENANYRPR